MTPLCYGLQSYFFRFPGFSRVALKTRLVCLRGSCPVLPPPPSSSNAPRGFQRAGQGTCPAVTADAAGRAGGLRGRDYR